MVQAGAWQQKGAPKLPEAKTSKLACAPESDRDEEYNKTLKCVKVFGFLFVCVCVCHSISIYFKAFDENEAVHMVYIGLVIIGMIWYDNWIWYDLIIFDQFASICFDPGPSPLWAIQTSFHCWRCMAWSMHPPGSSPFNIAQDAQEASKLGFLDFLMRFLKGILLFVAYISHSFKAVVLYP